MTSEHLLAALLLFAGAPASAGAIKFPKIDVRRPYQDFSSFQARITTASFKFDESLHDGFQMDFRSCDLTAYDLSANKYMFYAGFNTATKFPKKLPAEFSPGKIMELGTNPGLGVRKLHRQGITGKHVGVGIIDQALLSTHAEYADRLKLYEEIHCLGSGTSMHAPAVASIAVGKSIGVAPGADLYFIGQTNGNPGADGSFDFDLGYIAQSINRLVEVNRQLPSDEKIRVISVSLGMMKQWKGYDQAMQAIRNARLNNIFVITVEDRDFPMDGLGRQPLLDSENKDSFTGGLVYCSNKEGAGNDVLQVPMDSRTLADSGGDNAYYFSRVGGQSWLEPWMAGMYALACQVYPGITPEVFWKAALETADPVTFARDGKKYTLQKVINPVKLIEKIKKLRG